MKKESGEERKETHLPRVRIPPDPLFILGVQPIRKPLCARLKLLPFHLFQGIKWRIPLCCNLFFLLDRILGVASGAWRGGRYNQYGSYVPCPIHMQRGFRPIRVILWGNVCFVPKVIKVKQI